MSNNTEKSSLDLATVTRGDFEPHKGSSFLMQISENTQQEITLIDIVDEHRESNANCGSRRPFSLVFEVTSNIAYPQQIRDIQHEFLGQFELFIIPGGVFEGKARYHAVFN